MTRFLSTRSLRSILPAALLLAAFSSGAAHAASVDTDSHTVSVNLSGLDLASSSGQALARQRIASAVSRACDAPTGPDLEAWGLYDSCRAQATTRGIADFDQRFVPARTQLAATRVASARS